MASSQERPSEEAIREWLACAVAKALKSDPHDLRPDVRFDRYGLDSVAAVELTGELEAWLGRRLPPTLLYDYPTIGAVSAHLANDAG
ncbi:acyl carrier protein [Pendulispora albinea]|uniref:Acyl carrier protein n=1 Tax=Pendulispora albinea TaxID=2741071 RepID=A0ABZ2LP72_9BACT